MTVADDRTTSDYLPRQDLPDAWAGGRCPACGAAALKVIHLSNSPDYLLCGLCELSCEVATTGGVIRLKNIPDQLGFAEEGLRFRWVPPAILRQMMDNRVMLIQQKAQNAPAATAALSDDEVWQRARSLYTLGNKPKMIQFTLVRAGATRAQAEDAALKLKDWAQQENKKLSRRFWTLGGAAFSVILVIVLGLGITVSSINSGLDSVAHPVATQQPILPLQIIDLLPDVVKPGFLKSPPAQVVSSGPPKSRCPTISVEAARLFGGPASAWQPGGQVADSWQMINSGDPSVIQIPKGMYAGYIDNQTFMLISVNGPATIYNVNFVAIMCN